MNSTNFVHLNVHSEFSLKNSIIPIDGLIDSVKSSGMRAVAVCDENNLFASIKLYEKAFSSGVKPLISSELTIISDGEIGKIILIAQDNDGYRSIKELVSDAYEKGILATGYPVIDIEWLKGKTKGIIALSGGRKGLIGKSLLHNKDAAAENHIKNMTNLFGDKFYIELQRIGHPDDDAYVHAAVEKAAKFNIPVVATNAVTFLNPDDYHTHEVRVAITNSKSVNELRSNDPYRYTPEQYLKSADEMSALFSDIPSAITNSVEIARRCNINITLNVSKLPSFPTPTGMSEKLLLNTEAHKGLDQRLNQLFDTASSDYKVTEKIYRDRLDFELNVINTMGFPGYFLIVSDFIQWAKDNDIPVGPGRGSGAGSLVAYSLKITDLDPLQYDLLFERFLNPERVSMPDFDIDFCMDRREEVIKYVSHRYGENAVAQIVTFGTMAAKMAVRDVARALGFPYSVGNKISNMISSKPGTLLQDAIEESSELKFCIETEPDVKAVIAHSLKLEGIARQTGKHAGGVIIAPGNLTEFTATLNEVDKSGHIINKVSQLDKNDVETAGLVKFDFLGLKTLTIIQNAVNSVNKKLSAKNEATINISNIPLDDPDVYKIFQSGATTAVFQVESKGMKDLLKRMKPDRFEDLIALVALYRPGPLESGMVDNFINRKHGREEISYPDSTYQHESLKEILEPTYGVILYQEQVMQIAQVLSGYTLGGADMLRRAMGKKKPEEMEKQRSVFKQGAIDNGVDADLAMKIFDLVEKFAGYGFNKSHSAAYALIAYQTAWLKTKYPAEFMAAVLSGDMDNTDKIVTYVNECRTMGLEILSPNVNTSNRTFTPIDNKIIYGLGAVKNMGDSIIKNILNERQKNGMFKNLHDFCQRCTPNKGTIEAAIKSGALDDMGPHRSSLMATYPKAVGIGKQAAKKELGNPQINMFGSLMDDESIIKFEDTHPWDDNYQLAGERFTLGMYLTGHPITAYETELSSIISGKLVDLIGTDLEDGNGDLDASDDTKQLKWEDKNVTVAGLIMNMEIKISPKNSQQTGYLTIDDKSKQVDVMVFSKTLHDCQHLLQPDTTVIIEGKLKMDKKTKRIRLFASNIKTIDMARERNASGILLDLSATNFNADVKDKLKDLMGKQPEGYAEIVANFTGTDLETKRIKLGTYQIKITDTLIHELKNIVGKNNVSVEYKDKKQPVGVAGIAFRERQKIERIEDGQRTREMRHKVIAQEFENAKIAMGM